MDGIFLLQLSQSCCGIVEAIPYYITETGDSTWTNADSMFTLLSPTKRNTTTRGASVGELSISTGTRTDNIDESFVSAAASYGDLDTSQISW
jgi:hypothetical protein